MNADNDSLISYPCDFPIKVMGPNHPEFVDAMCFLARQFDDNWRAESLEKRQSKGGKYLGLTFTLHVQSRDQLDEVYRTLSSHPMVKVVL